VRITPSANNADSRLGQTITDVATRAFQISLVLTLLMFLYLLYGLISGQLADMQHMSSAEQLHALQVVQSLSFWLNISLVVLLVSSSIVYLEIDALGYLFLVLAAFLAYGFDFLVDTLVGGGKILNGPASQKALGEIHTVAILFAIPGILLVARQLVVRIRERLHGQDLTLVTYGKDVKRDDRKMPMFAAFAKCWQLPFCREGIRVKCPIFHARTKCWKERVGCMCEENIIILAMSDSAEQQTPAAATMAMGKQAGFVAIGDLITRSEQETRPHIQTRVGPRGVRIPTNPHLSAAQKRERCRNCVIYNEHQRQKYQLLSTPVTLLVPLLVYLNFDSLRGLLKNVLNGVDRTISQVSLSGHSPLGGLIKQGVEGSLSVETILIVCISLVLMTWSLRLLEYCMFKLKI
jgi:hypothetical protein